MQMTQAEFNEALRKQNPLGFYLDLKKTLPSLYIQTVPIDIVEFGQNLAISGHEESEIPLTQQETFIEAKQALIDLIIWYRDNYHKKDFCHTELINQAESASNLDELSPIEQIIDGWI